jgi:hypothetical protein
MNLNHWITLTLTEFDVYGPSERDIDDFVDWTINRFDNERNCIKPGEEVEVWLDLKEEA